MKRILIAIATVLSLGVTAANAELMIGDQWYVGVFTPDHPANPDNEILFINHLKDLSPGASNTLFGANTYNRVDSPNTLTNLPDVTTLGFKVDGNDLNPGSINVAGYAYILGKYDGPNAGAYVWYVQGLTTVSLYSTDPADSKYGLSHYAAFNATPVPDGGVTLMLLGGALVLLEGVRRTFSA